MLYKPRLLLPPPKRGGGRRQKKKKQKGFGSLVGEIRAFGKNTIQKPFLNSEILQPQLEINSHRKNTIRNS